MSKQVVTLYIDDTSVRLLVASGKKIKQWAEAPLEPGLVKGAVVLKEAEVAEKIKQLFNAQHIKAKKVVLGFSGLHSLTRLVSLPNLPKAMMSEAVIRSVKKLLPIPVEQLYLSWQQVSSAGGKSQVFVVGVPRKTIDSLIKTLHDANLQLSHMGVKPMVLTALVKEGTAILVDVQSIELDITIVKDRLPHPIRTILIRTVALPAEGLSWQEKLPLIISDLDRTIKFFDSNNKENPLDSTVPIYVSGELAVSQESQKAISEAVGYPVVALPSPMEVPANLDINRYMVNIALAFQASGGRELKSSVSRLNVLPLQYQPKAVSWKRIAAVPAVAVLVILLAALMILTQNTSGDMESLNTELSSVARITKQRQTEQQETKKNITELEKSVTSSKTSGNSLTQALTVLEKRKEVVNGNLKICLGALPKNTSLQTIKQIESNLTIAGKSIDEDEVLLFARNLDKSGRFAETVITSMQREGEVVEFTLNLKTKE